MMNGVDCVDGVAQRSHRLTVSRMVAGLLLWVQEIWPVAGCCLGRKGSWTIAELAVQPASFLAGRLTCSPVHRISGPQPADRQPFSKPKRPFQFFQLFRLFRLILLLRPIHATAFQPPKGSFCLFPSYPGIILSLIFNNAMWKTSVCLVLSSFPPVYALNPLYFLVFRLSCKLCSHCSNRYHIMLLTSFPHVFHIFGTRHETIL